MAGAAIGYGALSSYVAGLPRGRIAEFTGLVAVGLFPATAIVATAGAGLGLILLPLKATRGSGIALAGYGGAYLMGLLCGTAAFYALR